MPMIHPRLAVRMCLALLLAGLLLPAAADRLTLEQFRAPSTAVQGGDGADRFVDVPIAAPRGTAVTASTPVLAPGCYTVTMRVAAPAFGKTYAQVECVVDVPRHGTHSSRCP